MTSALATVGRIALDLLYPPRCAVCASNGSLLCDACLAELPRTVGDRCDICWLPLRDGVACHACAAHPLVLQSLRSALRYDGQVRHLIKAFKFTGQSSLAPSLARSLLETYETHDLRTEVVVPVPLTGLGKRLRGYNQAALLANELSKAVGVPDAEALSRVRSVKEQARSASAEERRRNVIGAFAVRKRVGGGGQDRTSHRRRRDHGRHARRLRSRVAGGRRAVRQRTDAGTRGLMQPDPTLVLFCGGMGGSAVEDALAEALRECALDTLNEARSPPAPTPATCWCSTLRRRRTSRAVCPPASWLRSTRRASAFISATACGEVILKHELQRPVYVGCGLPLIKADELAAVALGLADSGARRGLEQLLLGRPAGHRAWRRRQRPRAARQRPHPAAAAAGRSRAGEPRPAAHDGQPVRHRHAGRPRAAGLRRRRRPQPAALHRYARA